MNVGPAAKKELLHQKFELGIPLYRQEKEWEALGEYYGAAEPPVRCGVSHLSGLTEPPVYSYSA